jgi:copper chaperone
MLTFRIPNLGCDHCVHAVTQAILEVDPQAKVQADLASQQVQVQTSARAEAVAAALVAADYAPAG